MYLVDTNIFLEIFLHQEKSEDCKKFLKENRSNLHLSDFSIHSIGIILFRHKAYDVYHKFVRDTLPRIKLTSLPKERYSDLSTSAETIRLDFDEAYQYSICKALNLTLVTMDQDFASIDDIEILFV